MNLGGGAFNPITSLSCQAARVAFALQLYGLQETPSLGCAAVIHSVQ